MAGASTPWATGMTVMGWSARNASPGSACVYYPVNDAPPFNPRNFTSDTGRRFLAYYQRQQNRYTGVGNAGCSFNIDITGQNLLTTGLWIGDPLMQACGFDTAATTVGSLTLASPNVGDGNLVRADLDVVFQDNYVKGNVIADAVGGVTLNFTPGEIPTATFDMVGLSTTNSLSSSITPITPPYGQAVAGATFSIAAHALILRSLVISTNPVLAMRKSVAGTGGYAAPVIVGYECTALARVELDAATHDFETSWAAATSTALAPYPNTAMTLSLALPVGGAGTIAGARTLTLTGNFLLDGMPQRVDDGDGILCLDVPLILDPSVILATANANSLKLVWSA